MISEKKIARLNELLTKHSCAVPDSYSLHGVFTALGCIDTNRENSQLLGITISGEPTLPSETLAAMGRNESEEFISLVVDFFADIRDELSALNYTPFFEIAMDKESGEELCNPTRWILGFSQGISYEQDAWRGISAHQYFGDDAKHSFLMITSVAAVIQNVVASVPLSGNMKQLVRGEPNEFLRKGLRGIAELDSQTAESLFIVTRGPMLQGRYVMKYSSDADVQDMLRRMNAPHTMIKNVQSKIGRNELCHCGSGKKFKKCCQKVS